MGTIPISTINVILTAFCTTALYLLNTIVVGMKEDRKEKQLFREALIKLEKDNETQSEAIRQIQNRLDALM